jgi:hypothetical protein
MENFGPIPPGPEGWRVDGEPVLSIGALEGEWQYQLYWVRGAVRLQAGGIAIANAGTEEIRIFGPDGSFLRLFGGEGGGPGEFQGLTLVGNLPGDTLVAVGRRDHRVSLFHADAGFVRSFPLESLPAGPLQGFGLLSDGRILLQAGFHFDPDAPRSGPTRGEVTFYSARYDGAEAVEFPPLPGTESWMQVGEEYASVMQVPFGKQPSGAVTANRVYLGSGDRYEILGYAPDGSLERIIRLVQDPTPLDEDDVSRYIEAEVSEAEDEEAARDLRSAFAEIPFPEELPAYLGFRTDPLDCLWVEESRLPGDETPVWTVFDPEGTLLARVALPVGIEVLEIGEDYILGLDRDDFDVEYVRMYTLERTGP